VMQSSSPKPASGAPERRVLQGRFGRLEPLDDAKHGESLWRAVAGADAVWAYLPYGPWADEASFRAWLRERQPSRTRSITRSSMRRAAERSAA